MALILTTPISSTGPGTSTLLTDTIPANTAKVVDAVDVLNYPNIKWIVSITDAINHQKITQEVIASYNSTTMKYSRYGLVGDLIPHLLNVNFELLGNLAQLQITNNSGHLYKTEVSRQFSL